MTFNATPLDGSSPALPMSSAVTPGDKTPHAIMGGPAIMDSQGNILVPVAVTLQGTSWTSGTLQSNASANGNGTALFTLGYGTITFTVSGTFSATVNFEGTEDNSNWSGMEVTPFNSTSPILSTTAPGSFSGSCAGMQSVRARISGYVSGSVTVTAHAVPLGGLGSSGGGGGSGSNASISSTGASVPGSATYIAANKSGSLTGLTLDASGNLNVNVAAGGGSGGTSSSFGGTYPATGTAIGASDGTNMQGLLVESASNKNLRVGIYSGANEASVTGANALKVDGSAVTQPISGTVTANVQHGNVVSAANSSATALGANGTFTGTGESSLSYSAISVEVFANQASAVGGLSIQQSQDNTNWDTTDTFTISASAAFSTTVNLVGQFFRIVYTNGATAQTVFRLQTIKQAAEEVLPRSLTALGNLKTSVQEALPAGSNTIGSITQAGAPWAQNITQFGGNPVVTGTGPSGNGIPRVTVSTDSQVQPIVGASGGSVPYHTLTAATTNFTNVKSSACQMYGFSLSNTSGSAIYVKFYDKATAPATTDTPRQTVQVPANSTVIRAFPLGLKFTSGFGWAATGGMADSDNTAIAANCIVDFDLNS